MRADRLLKIMLLLQSQGGLTSKELAKRLEVSERTVFRDMESLSAAGVPVYAERGAHGGWRLTEGYRTDWMQLSKGEVVSLLAAKPRRHMDDLGWSGSFDAALLKLLASLSPTLRRDVDFTRERLYVDGDGWHPSGEDVPQLQIVKEAVWEGRQLRMDYASASGSGTGPGSGCRTVHPLGLVMKGSLWYLIAIPADAPASGNGSAEMAEPRSYRVSRIRSAELLAESAERPDGFDLAAYWERSVNRFREQLPRLKARAFVHKDACARLEKTRYVHVTAWEEPATDSDWRGVKLAFDTLESAADIALGFGAQLLIVEPAELRRAVVDRARSVISLYGS